MASRGTRRGKRSRQRREARSLDAELGPDRSRLVYAFADGWAIRQPTTLEDVLREGALMRNCLRPGSRSWMVYPERFVGVDIWSLRDPENFPHAIIDVDDGEGVAWMWGSCDNPRPKVEYVARVQAFLDTLPVPLIALAWADADDSDVAWYAAVEACVWPGCEGSAEAR